MKTNTARITISRDYAVKENTLRWIINYCKKNRILCREVVDYTERMMYFNNNQPYHYLEIVFKSVHQMRCFQRRGNSNYPFFEFL